jgi:hypothetical protein
MGDEITEKTKTYLSEKGYDKEIFAEAFKQAHLAAEAAGGKLCSFEFMGVKIALGYDKKKQEK